MKPSAEPGSYRKQSAVHSDKPLTADLKTLHKGAKSQKRIEDDQIVPYAGAGPLSAKLLRDGTLKTYKGSRKACPRRRQKQSMPICSRSSRRRRTRSYYRSLGGGAGVTNKLRIMSTEELKPAPERRSGRGAPNDIAIPGQFAPAASPRALLLRQLPRLRSARRSLRHLCAFHEALRREKGFIRQRGVGLIVR